MRGVLYLPGRVRHFFAGVAVVALLGTATAFAESELGAQLPDNSRKVAEHRFKSGTDFDGTLKYYKNVYPAAQYPRKAVVNQPGVKAVHIANSSGRGSWEGLNIYEANDEVRIYVVPAPSGGGKKKK